MPAEHHAVVAADKCRGEIYAVYDGLIGRCYGHMGLGHEKNGWFVGWGHSHAILSNCRDTTWIVTSPYMSHVWHVDKAGTTIIVGSGTQVHLIFADGVVVDFDKPDFDKPHSNGKLAVYYDHWEYLVHLVWDNPNGRLLIFNINELHLLATILARSYQWIDYKPEKQLASKSCRSSISQADCQRAAMSI